MTHVVAYVLGGVMGLLITALLVSSKDCETKPTKKTLFLNVDEVLKGGDAHDNAKSLPPSRKQ